MPRCTVYVYCYKEMNASILPFVSAGNSDEAGTVAWFTLTYTMSDGENEQENHENHTLYFLICMNQ